MITKWMVAPTTGTHHENVAQDGVIMGQAKSFHYGVPDMNNAAKKQSLMSITPFVSSLLSSEIGSDSGHK